MGRICQDKFEECFPRPSKKRKLSQETALAKQKPYKLVSVIKGRIMPYQLKKACSNKNCPNFAQPGKRYCKAHQKLMDSQYNQLAKIDGKDRDYWSSASWRRKRARFIKANPYCFKCGAPATQVDHKIPVDKGGTDDDFNLQSLCKPCHSAKSVADGRWGRG